MAPTISKRNKPGEVIETSNLYDVLEVEEITIDDPSYDITSAPSMQNSVNNNDISGMNSCISMKSFLPSRSPPRKIDLDTSLPYLLIEYCKQLLFLTTYKSLPMKKSPLES
ncbi:hypothetical protein CEXT_807281 [Caerostris extrusa]|uniref:Uncharacterized protein n=1 Tax=Caerostris extrusa TaxID=172846 RepID=A0AAV4MPK8_CAEEX|nr:hypothetical protein CEXT_807281 [Caerostris extrusa]